MEPTIKKIKVVSKEKEDYVQKPIRINFYGQNNVFGYFSNFSNHPIEIDGSTWPTSEHYFQAQKFDDKDYREEIRLALNPTSAKKMGQSRKYPIKTNWEDIKDKVMLDALRAKFTQHKNLKSLLMGTKDAYLSEHTKNDKYWGDGGDDSGKNKLGILLMELRSELAKDHSEI